MLTITCPFAGKKFCLDRVLNSMRKLQIPSWPVKWVFFDNSGDGEFNQRLRYFLHEMQGRCNDGSVLTHVQVMKKGKYDVTKVYQLYNDMKHHVIGNWLALEDDVFDYPVDLISRFYREVYSSYNLAIVGAHMETRRGYPGPLAWRVEPINGRGMGLRPVEPRPSGLTIIDAIHTGCTLIRPSAYANYTFRQEGMGENILGHDIHLCIDSKERGLLTGILWNTRAGHMSEEGIKYPMGVINLNTSTEVRTNDPLVSVITPTADRPKLLSRLIGQLKEQTYQHYEHLICNDGQGQYVAKVAETEGGEKTRYYEMGFKHGFSGAPQRNQMLQKAGGELVVFLDDDILIEKDYLRTMVNMWREGHMIGFAQIELEDTGGVNRIIPENRDMVNSLGHVDTLCAFVDTSIAKGFFWDLFDEHDFRYFQQILSYTRGAFGWTPKVVGKNTRQFSRGEKDPGEKTATELVLQLSRFFKEPTPEIEDLVCKDPQAALQYVMNAYDGKRWEKGEASIARNSQTALFYLTNVLGGTRYPAAEELLSQDISTALAYSRQTKLRWKDLGRIDIEQRIFQSPTYSADYAILLGISLEEAEEVIKRDPRAWDRYLKAGLSQD